MRRMLAASSLVFALYAGMAIPAMAGGDFEYEGGVNPYGAAIPVPAPIPVPADDADWYFRADFAAGFGGDPSVTTQGTPFGSGTAAGSIGLNSAWLNENFEPSFTGGVGVGYVWAPSFRTDLTVDIHSVSNAKFDGSQVYSDGAVNQTLTVSDKTKFMSTILLANGYFDIRTGTALTPYVGGGVGFTVNQLTRNDITTDSGATGGSSVGGRSNRVEFAAAGMAGLTYDMNSFVSIDVGYRYLYIGGSDVSLTINGVTSSVDIGDVGEHQVRAGFRFYVN